MTLIFALLALVQATQTAPADATVQAPPLPTQQTQVQTAAAITSAAPAPAPATRTVCKRETIPGSNRTQRVCRTEQQMDDSREAARRFMERNVSGQPERETSE